MAFLQVVFLVLTAKNSWRKSWNTDYKSKSACCKLCFDIIKHSTDVLNILCENITPLAFTPTINLSEKTMKRQSSKMYKNQINLKVHH